MKIKKKYFLRLLGIPQLNDVHGQNFTFATQKSAALLGMIAATGESGLQRDTAAAMLWSRSPEAQGRTNLRQALSSLNSLAGEKIVVPKGASLSIDRSLVEADIWTLADSGVAERTPSTGFGAQFMEGLDVNEPEFEDWLTSRRSFFARSVRDALFDAGNDALKNGRASDALEMGERILSLDPFEETGVVLCLKAHAAKGERSRVQIRFEEYAKLLVDELGIAVGPDLAALKDSLLAPVTPRAASLSATNVPTILVLPFRTLSDLPDHRYFAEGLSDDVIAQLPRFSTLRVVSFGDETAPSSDFSRGLTPPGLVADYALKGSIRWLDDKVRLSVELVEVQTGAVKWAERLDRRADDAFDLQDEVSGYLVGAIPYRIEEDIAKKAAGKSAEDLQAFDLMILGKRLRDTISLHGNLAARKILRKAVEKDQGLARAHMYLSDSYVVQHWLGHLGQADKEKALYHARRAVALDPMDVHIQDHLGFSLLAMGYWDAAEAQINNALEMSENEIESISWCGYALLMLGKHEQAAEIIESVAKRRTTLPPTFEWILGQLYSFQGRDADVVRILNGAALLNSIGLAFRAGSEARLGMQREARFTLEEFRDARSKDLALSGQTKGQDTSEATFEWFRNHWRRQKDSEHLAEGLRLAGMVD